LGEATFRKELLAQMGAHFFAVRPIYARMSAMNASDTPTPGFEPEILEAPKPARITPSGSGTSVKPITPRERIKAVLVSVSAIVAGTAMWIGHQFYVSDLIYRLFGDEPVQRFRLKIDIVWCRPTGAILILFGCLVLWGALTKRSNSAAARGGKGD
jgi:hypothetical protein